jgi:hypothetical protein
VVEGSGFENRRGGNSTRGSNPFFSAKSLRIWSSGFGPYKGPRPKLGPNSGSWNPSQQRFDDSTVCAEFMFSSAVASILVLGSSEMSAGIFDSVEEVRDKTHLVGKCLHFRSVPEQAVVCVRIDMRHQHGGRKPVAKAVVREFDPAELGGTTRP